MVARLAQILTWKDVWRFSQPRTADPPPDNLQPRYNLAPTDELMIVRLAKDGRREAVRVRWGLIPGWAKNASSAVKCINARAETVERLPSFRDAFVKRRCLVLASGFYEWKKIDKDEKQPYYITLKSGVPMTFAGLWESWMPRRGPAVETCSIVTTTPNQLLAPLHSRMPVTLDEVDHAGVAWPAPCNGRRAESEIEALPGRLHATLASRQTGWQREGRRGLFDQAVDGEPLGKRRPPSNHSTRSRSVGLKCGKSRDLQSIVLGEAYRVAVQ